MCDFISYIEAGGKILFLTPKDIESKYGKQTLKDSKDNDFLGHNAVRAFYGLKANIWVDKENKDFWNGNLPQEIKNAWNNGDLDGMFKYFQSDDINYVFQNAPIEFSIWMFKCRNENGNYFEAIKKDTYNLSRRFAYLATQDYEAMKKDSNNWNRQIAYLATQDYEAMKKDNDDLNRRIAYLAAQGHKMIVNRPKL